MNLSSAKELFRKRIRGFALILGLVLAYFCFTFLSGYLPVTGKDSVNDSFREFTLSLFRQEAASSTLNLHYTLQNPSDYGILNAPITFGSWTEDSVSAMASVENCRAMLETFPYQSLSEENKLTYDILDSYLDTAKEGAKYLLYDEPLSPMTGIQAQLPVLLAEYQFHYISDVETYLSLMETTPAYFKSLIEFEKSKAEKGLFLSDEVADSVLEQCRSFINMREDNYLYPTFEERLSKADDVTEEQADTYIEQNRKAIDDFLIPAYESLVHELKTLKESNIETTSAQSLPDGKDYYEYVVKRETGSSRSISELKALIKRQMRDDASVMGKLHVMETAAVPNLSLEGTTPQALLEELEGKIQNAFPAPADVKTDIKYVPKAMEPYLSPAFYLIPCIDNSSENVIYINQAHTMKDLKLFTTLAHEGYPGHLYQTTYFAEKKLDPIRSLLNFGGYTEGWATYAEMCSYYLTPLDKKEAAMAQKNSSLILGLYALADIGIHYDGWTLADTVSFFSDYGITDENVIPEIYELIVSDPANYLKYYVGYVEMLELKKEYLSEKGENFSQKDFHKAVLDVGPAPFDIVRKYILK